jgi:uncharacterized membrane protein
MTSTTKSNSTKYLISIVGTAVAVGFLLVLSGTVSLSSAQTQEQVQEQQQTD